MKTMSFVFRGHVVFEYIPNEGVKLRNIKGTTSRKLNYDRGTNSKIPAFDYCCFINEDYKLMSEFFDKVYRYAQGEKVELKDIEVY